MIKQIITLFFGITLIVTLQSVFAVDIVKEYNITETDLPFVGQEDFLLQLQSNETLFFNPTNISNNNLQLGYPSNYTFGVNETNYTLSVIYSIPITNIAGNQTFEESMLINNSLNNISTEILFRINIEDIPFNQTTINNDSQTFEVAIINDGYNITISSNTLPKIGLLDFDLTGHPNQQGQITFCGEFLTCPQTFQYDNSGKATIQIGYNIPFGQAVGTYTRTFAIQSNNTFRQGKIIFNIKEPEYVIQHYVYTDDCFINKDSMIRCVQEQQEFNSKQLSDFINALLKEDKSICPTINETIKYVMQGEINNDLKILYDNAIRDLNNSRSENNRLVEENKNLKVENSELIAQKDNLQTDTNLLVKQAQDEAFEQKIKAEQEKKNTEQEYEDKWDFWTNFILGVIIVGGVISYILYRYSKENWW